MENQSTAATKYRQKYNKKIHSLRKSLCHCYPLNHRWERAILTINSSGAVINSRIKCTIRPFIERGPMHKVDGIIVHQTDSTTAAGTLSQYKKAGSNGAHFLIDKDGTIYQTASVFRQTAHVGILKSRCLVERKCSSAEFRTASRLRIHDLSKHELHKSWPRRYPSNRDAIGIEIVGKFLATTGKFEPVTVAENSSLRWLIQELSATLNVPAHEIFRHPDVSYKQPSEAETAKW